MSTWKHLISGLPPSWHLKKNWCSSPNTHLQTQAAWFPSSMVSLRILWCLCLVLSRQLHHPILCLLISEALAIIVSVKRPQATRGRAEILSVFGCVDAVNISEMRNSRKCVKQPRSKVYDFLDKGLYEKACSPCNGCPMGRVLILRCVAGVILEVFFHVLAKSLVCESICAMLKSGCGEYGEIYKTLIS